ncbi:peptidase inhibitor family I36 protein [Streptomyces griseus]|uniref:peptidase inhibitor family I36 protein n=1 Tax=Streptomyces griseus TaxID=1911 RepID=UPI0037BB3D40
MAPSAEEASQNPDVLPDTYVFIAKGANVCPDGYVCLYEYGDLNSGAPGRILATKVNLKGLGDWNFSKVANSYYNHTVHTVAMDWQEGNSLVDGTIVADAGEKRSLSSPENNAIYNVTFHT